MNRCFVISPIGPEGSQIREHADAVFNYIVVPAMKECGIEACRSDHLQEPGRITEQMYREILSDVLCVAVLTGHNPNVFYELAVAHAAGRPVIVLLEKGESLPFDISDLRCVFYDLKPKSLFENVYGREVVAHVKSLEASGWKVPGLFGNSIVQPVGTHNPNPLSFYRDGSEFGTSENWMKLLTETENVFEIMGIHLQPWRGGKKFSELLARKAGCGCTVRILLMHPDNPTLSQMINESLTEVDIEDTTREIQEMGKYFSRIAAKQPNVSVRQILRGTLHCQTTRTDRYGVYLPYLYSRRRRYCPLWQCLAGSDMYDVIVEEFDGLWIANENAC